MNTLKNKVDFAVIVSVNHANPNGDPLNGNRPRQDIDRLGEISDVAIKRKIRNRLMDLGEKIFVQSNDRRAEGDTSGSLKERLVKELGAGILKVERKKELTDEACKKWLDVRAFGQVFPFKESKGNAKKKGKGKTEEDAEVDVDNNDEDEGEDTKSVSASVRGPVSIHPAFSIAPIMIDSSQITKSVNLEGDGNEMGSDRMGMKHRVQHGAYVFYGSMNTQLAKTTHFSDEDAKLVKEAIRTLFQNDSSSARPDGSMEVHKVYWWEHNNPTGQYSTAKVHNSVRNNVKLKKEGTEPKDMGDYVYPSKEDVEKELPGLKCEVLDGE